MTRVAIALIKVYQVAISPVLPSTCKFAPSCSEYAISALKKYGLLKGLWLALIRVLRCNPLSSGGYDPLK